MKDNGVICPMPFIQFSTTTMGNYQACCIAKQVDSMSFDNTTPMEFFNSDHMKQLRHDMANGNKSDLYNYTCQNCVNQEKLYNKSKRLDALTHHIHGKLVSDNTINQVLQNKNTNLKPKDIDHLKMKVFGNICNLTCVMCYPGTSSALAAEMKMYDILPKHMNGKTVHNAYRTIDKDKLYADLDIICPVIREFEIVGGEPLMMKDALEMIEWIIAKGYSKNMEFRIITNATLTNIEFLNLMKHFKRATFIISLDGFGKKDEYMRTGTVWEEKVENIKNMIYAGIDISWSNTIQLLNIGYLNEIHLFVKSLQDDHPGKKIWPAHMNNLLTSPIGFRASNVPPIIAKVYLDKYKGLNFDNINTHINTLRNRSNLITLDDTDTELLSAMKTYRWYDEKRGTCLLDEWPEFENYYSAVGRQV
jgi:hypothetical protein